MRLQGRKRRRIEVTNDSTRPWPCLDRRRERVPEQTLEISLLFYPCEDAGWRPAAWRSGCQETSTSFSGRSAETSADLRGEKEAPARARRPNLPLLALFSARLTSGPPRIVRTSPATFRAGAEDHLTQFPHFLPVRDPPGSSPALRGGRRRVRPCRGGWAPGV